MSAPMRDLSGSAKAGRGLAMLDEAKRIIRWKADGRPAKGFAPIVRVLAKCEQRGECWEFQGRTDQGGYGIAFGARSQMHAHRIVFMQLHGELPSNIFVCHSCDNRLCCNPAHLFAGDALANNRDRHEKGRTRGLPDYGSLTHCKHGHPFTPKNTYARSDGGRRCRTCTLERNRQYEIRRTTRVREERSAAVAAQLAALEAALARPRTHETARPLSDEEVAWESLQEHIAEERKHDRQHMSDWTARRTA